MFYPNLTFNGERKDYVAVMEKRRPYWAPRRREILKIEGMQGGHLTDTVIDVLVIQTKLLIDAESPAHLRKISEDMATWFNVDVPAALQFDDEPDRVYYAVVDGELNPDEFVSYAEIEVTFLVPSGAKMGADRKFVFESALEQIENRGSASVKPIFTAVVNQPITNIDIVTPDAYMRVGAPASITETVVNKRTRVFSDELASLDGWSAASNVDNGIVSGTMYSDGTGFKASDFGADQSPAVWQGPSLQKDLVEQLQDFELEIGLEQVNSMATIGMMEITLLDPTGAILVKVGMEDIWRSSKANQGKFQLGPLGAETRTEQYRTPDNPGFWKNFRGMIRVVREGNVWTVYFSEISEDRAGNKVHNNLTSWTYRFTDYDNQYLQKAAAVQISLRKWSGSEPTDMRVTRVQIWKLNEEISIETPLYMAQAGDIIEINHLTSEITINGEPRLWMKDFGSSFFPLKPGITPISYSPDWLVDLSVRWQDRYT